QARRLPGRATPLGHRAAGRRVVAYALAVALGIGVFVGLDHLRATAGRALVHSPAATGVPAAPGTGQALAARPVAPGDTLWSIAVELRPDADPRPLVDELARINGGPALQAGGTVLVPVDLLRGGLP